MTNRFAGKVALVTGAGAGIGRAIANRLGSEGAAVAVVDRDLSSAAQTAAGVSGALPIAADVTSPDQVEAAFETVAAELGGLDVLVNNAGVVRYGAVPEFSVQDWDLVMDTNVTGTFLTVKYAVPLMRARGGGAIVNTASAQAFASQENVAAYSASKGAIVAMTRTLALDHAQDRIRVNCVCPGSVETPMLRYAAEYFDAGDPAVTLRHWGKLHPIGRLIQPAEVAGLVAFLASDDALAITGAPYLIDGGLTAKLGV